MEERESLTEECPEKVAEEEKEEKEEPKSWKVLIHNLPRFASVGQVKSILLKAKLSGWKRLSPAKNGTAAVEFRRREEAEEAAAKLASLEQKGKALTTKVIPVRDGRERRRQGQATVALAGAELEAAMLDAAIPLRNLPYEEQLSQKAAESAKLRAELLPELDGAHPAKLREVLPCPDGPKAKRNKCEMAIGAGEDGGVVIGFRVCGQAQVAPLTGCLHVTDEMKAVAREFAPIVAASGLSWSGEGQFWQQLTMRQFGQSLTLIVCVGKDGGEKASAAKEASLAFAAQRSHIASLFWSQGDGQELELLHGSEYAEETLLGLRFRVSPQAFFQTSSSAAECLYSAVQAVVEEAESAAEAKPVVLDICCGTGTLGLLMAPKAAFVLGLEIVAEAVRDARANAELNAVANAKFLAGKAEDLFNSFPHYLPPEAKSAPVLGILDPPRAGVHSKLIAGIRRTERLRSLVYVSCHPRLARQNFQDLTRPVSNKFAGKAFTLQFITPVDMFPNTAHFEWILFFSR